MVVWTYLKSLYDFLLVKSGTSEIKRQEVCFIYMYITILSLSFLLSLSYEKLNVQIGYSVSLAPPITSIKQRTFNSMLCTHPRTIWESHVTTPFLFNRKPVSHSSMDTFLIYMYFCVLYTFFLEPIIFFLSFYAWICYFQSYRCCFLFSYCFGGSPSCILSV